MKAILFLIPAVLFGSRADDCFAMRGNKSPEAIEAMSRLLENAEVRTCAAENLRVAGAVDVLRTALVSGKSAETRATAARILGWFERNDLLPELSAAAGDENLLIASNGFAALANYQD